MIFLSFLVAHDGDVFASQVLVKEKSIYLGASVVFLSFPCLDFFSYVDILKDNHGTPRH